MAVPMELEAHFTVRDQVSPIASSALVIQAERAEQKTQ